jgi:hypothetical protein
MIRNKQNLIEALKLVLEHKKQMDKEFWQGIHSNVLGIQRGDGSRENLKKWFILATGPGWRAGPAPRLDQRKIMIEAFDNWYEKVIREILPQCSGQKAMDKMIKELVKIERIGPKIAGVYLRDIIYHVGVWPQFKEYLYLPIDRHTRNILIHKLEAFEEPNVPAVGESYFTEKNRQFQEALNQIHRPRVEFDYFWTIGSYFCSFYLCNFCWIREVCQDKSPII